MENQLSNRSTRRRGHISSLWLRFSSDTILPLSSVLTSPGSQASKGTPAICVMLLHSAPFPKQGNGPRLAFAAKEQRISQRRTFHDLVRPLVAPGYLHAKAEISAAFKK